MKDPTFDIRNEMGKVSEIRFQNYLVYKDYRIEEVSEGYEPRKDIAFRNRNGEITTAEIKADRYDSPRLPIEIESFGKPSGIYSTESEYYITDCWVDGKFYIAETEALKRYIEFLKPNIRKVRNKTNESDTYIYLLDKDSGIKVEAFIEIILPPKVIDINREEMEELLHMVI